MNNDVRFISIDYIETDYFLKIYISEILLRILSKLSILDTNSNTLIFFDISILMSECCYKSFGNLEISFLPLRLFRLLNLMKIKSIENMLKSLRESIKPLLESFATFFLFILFYAIANSQLFFISLSKKCFLNEFGISQRKTFCENSNCNKNYFCSFDFSNNSIENFNNLFNSFILTFRIITLDNWSVILFNIQRSFFMSVWLYFLLIIVFGNFFLLNLNVAVLKVNYSKTQNKLMEKTLKNEENNSIDHNLKLMKKKGAYKNMNKIKNQRKNSIYLKNEICEFYKGKIKKKSPNLLRSKSFVKKNLLKKESPKKFNSFNVNSYSFKKNSERNFKKSNFQKTKQEKKDSNLSKKNLPKLKLKQKQNSFFVNFEERMSVKRNKLSLNLEQMKVNSSIQRFKEKKIAKKQNYISLILIIKKIKNILEILFLVKKQKITFFEVLVKNTLEYKDLSGFEVILKRKLFNNY